ncbi:MAG TPA: mitochondrial fission ELM1 family protein [Caulobacteraceae bacterium]|jgi:mitochondrial fission protein ELM1|nr:mitochondrial fission ELM1 family protein [Caulobacteraceae bacterium]
MSKLTIWAVSDGRSGIENQALGLAEAVARLRPAEIVIKRVAYRRGLARLPSLLNLFPLRGLAEGSSPIEPPWPDLWIGAGRASLALSVGMRRWSKAATFVVQAQDPRLPAGLFDLVVPPRHDRVHGDNVFSLTGAPNRLAPERLAADHAAFAGIIEPLPRPRAAVMIGGRSRAFDLSPSRAEAMAHELDLALEQEGAALLMTFSRRTPERAKAILTERLAHHPGITWDGAGPNPYYAFLAAADFVAVTEDSTNMAAEAASVGAPVFVLKMDGRSLRMRRFHEDLEARGAARPFGGAFYRWTYEPLRETDRAAEEILRRMDARLA